MREGNIVGLLKVFFFFFILGCDCRAKRAVANLSSSVPKVCRVLRWSQTKTIPVSELVVGDVVFLEPGQIIPADMRLVEASSLEVNESILTVPNMFWFQEF